MKKYFEKGQYGLYYFKSNNDNNIKLYAGIKVLDRNGTYEDSRSVYLLTLNQEVLNSEVVNVLENKRHDDIYVIPKNKDTYCHNMLVIKWQNDDYVLGDFLTLNSQINHSSDARPFPDESCTLRLLIKNERKLNKAINRFLTEKLEEINTEGFYF